MQVSNWGTEDMCCWQKQFVFLNYSTDNIFMCPADVSFQDLMFVMQFQRVSLAHKGFPNFLDKFDWIPKGTVNSLLIKCHNAEPKKQESRMFSTHLKEWELLTAWKCCVVSRLFYVLSWGLILHGERINAIAVCINAPESDLNLCLHHTFQMRFTPDAGCLFGLLAAVILAIIASSSPTVAYKLTDSELNQSDFDADRIVRRSAVTERSEPPRRPKNFQSVADLNKYLSDITDYYTVLGRPRSATFIFSSILLPSSLIDISGCTMCPAVAFIGTGYSIQVYNVWSLKPMVQTTLSIHP